MRISTRLSLTFSTIASLFFVAFGITIYLFSSAFIKNEFQERLRERVVITEKVFLEKDSFNPKELDKINEQFLHTLPKETEEVVLLIGEKDPLFKYNYPKKITAKLTTNDSFDFVDIQIQGASRIFHIKEKNYLIIVTAVNEVGLQNLFFLKSIIVILVLIGIPLISLGSFILTKKALSPISKKIDHANRIGASNLHQRLKVYNPDDEIGKMAIAFNKLLDRLEVSFVAQKSFIRNASHEIKNPLTAIMGEAEIVISKSRTKEEYQKSLGTILAEAETLNTTVNNLLQLSKVTANEENIQYEIIQLDEFINVVKESFDFLYPENQIIIEITHSGLNYSVLGNKNLLKTAIINLFDNACKFSSNDKVDVLLNMEKGYSLLTIKDKGIGIIDSDLEKIMTPFYRGNNAIKIKGSGIGLSLSSKIIGLHKGVLEVHTRGLVGIKVSIKLPIVQVDT